MSYFPHKHQMQDMTQIVDLQSPNTELLYFCALHTLIIAQSGRVTFKKWYMNPLLMHINAK